MQLSLFDLSEFTPPKPCSRSEEADALGISLLELLDREEQLNAEFYGLSYPERCESVFWLSKPLEYIRYDRFSSGDLPAKPKGLRQIRLKWLQSKQDDPAPKRQCKQSQIKSWSEPKLFANRCNRLHKRMGKSFGLQSLREDAIWNTVLQNPMYFGVCPLPSESSCEINPGQLLLWRDKAIAIEKENQARRHEANDGHACQ